MRSSRRSRSGSRGRDRSSKKHRQDKRRRPRSSSRSSKPHHQSSSNSSSSNSSSSGRRSRSGCPRDEDRNHRRRQRYRDSSSSSSDRNLKRSQCDSYKYQVPNNTIMVRGFPSHISGDDIRKEIYKCGIMVKDVRIIKAHDTGASRGFGFVEFSSIADAKQWMDMKKGVVLLKEKYEANLVYSMPKASDGTSINAADWNCHRCLVSNFRRRENCYKCGAPQPEDPETKASLLGELSSHPTTLITLYNLDMLTTEEDVLQAFMSREDLCGVPIKSVKLQRELEMGISRGFCHVEANNILDSSNILKALKNDPLKVGGRTVLAAFGKGAMRNTKRPPVVNPLSSSSAAQAAMAAAQWSSTHASCTTTPQTGPPCADVTTEAEVEQNAQYCASAYAKTSEEYASYLQYYRQYYTLEMNKRLLSVSFPGAQTSNPAVVESPSSGSQAAFDWPQQHMIENSQGLQFNRTDGNYYYQYQDSAATPNHFPNANPIPFQDVGTQQHQTVLPSDCIEDVHPDRKTNSVKARTSKEMKMENKVKVAKRVVKEMEKWAKSLNQKKDAFGTKQTSEPRESYRPTNSLPSAAPTTISSTARSHVLDHHQYLVRTGAEKRLETYLPDGNDDSCDEDDQVNLPGATGAVKPNRGDLSFVDATKLVCLLCKRKFSNLEVLQRHVKLSDLHKKNLEALKK